MENVRERERLTVESGSRFITRVFFYMFIALLFTAVVSTVVGVLFSTFIGLKLGDGGMEEVINADAFLIYLVVLIISIIMLIATSIWFHISAFRGKHSLVVPFALYALAMGTLGSFFVIFVDWQSIAIAFGITCLAFGSMALIGFLTRKRNMNFLLIVILGLFIGVVVLTLVNLIFYFVPALQQLAAWNYLVIEYAVLGICLLITIWDVWRINKIAERGEANNNLALYCAFNLYVDFINLFIRILALVMRARSR